MCSYWCRVVAFFVGIGAQLHSIGCVTTRSTFLHYPPLLSSHPLCALIQQDTQRYGSRAIISTIHPTSRLQLRYVPPPSSPTLHSTDLFFDRACLQNLLMARQLNVGGMPLHPESLLHVLPAELVHQVVQQLAADLSGPIITHRRMGRGVPGEMYSSGCSMVTCLMRATVSFWLSVLNGGFPNNNYPHNNKDNKIIKIK
jgi:hypothetical protein